ncbi:MAG: MBL fold metallo-hydrolase [Anaerolineae bacterium]
MKIVQLPLGPIQTNCYIFACEETMTAAVVDPAWDGRSIAATAEEHGWQISYILLTHSHFDHVGGLAQLREETGAPIYIHPEAIPMLETAVMSASFFQLTIPAPPAPDEMLSEGQILHIGSLEAEVLFTPGHAPGHVCFHLSKQHVLFDGDVLFQQSIGRTDLPGGDYAVLMQSIWEKLMVLPDETHVFSGHGPATTIGDERRWNPFLQEEPG